MDLSKDEFGYLCAQLKQQGEAFDAFRASSIEDRQSMLQYSKAREQSVINAAREAVREAMREEREADESRRAREHEYIEALFSGIDSRLHSCTSIQDAAIDQMRSDLGEMRIEVTGTSTHAKKIPALETRLDVLEKRPGNQAIAALSLVAGAAVAVGVPAAWEWLKKKVAGT